LSRIKLPPLAIRHSMEPQEQSSCFFTRIPYIMPDKVHALFFLGTAERFRTEHDR
jgi:hypothetical protein